VLVVDDDQDALDVIATVIEEAGHDVMRARNGREALQQLHDSQGRCDLILLDLLMPVMNGWDFRRRQRETPAFARIPVFLMSAGAHLAVVRDELQASGCVAKPIDAGEILDVVKRHCS
jgi:CheY-like chemotaxis protein